MTNPAPQFDLRPFGQPDAEADYQLIHAFADRQVPYDRAGNRDWLGHRRAFDERRWQRRHYIALDAATREAVAYAAIEQQPHDPPSFRIYLVFDPQRWSFGALGSWLYRQLLADAHALQASKLVCIEYARDTAFCAFLEAHGFTQAGEGIYNGFDIIRYELPLSPSPTNQSR